MTPRMRIVSGTKETQAAKLRQYVWRKTSSTSLLTQSWPEGNLKAQIKPPTFSLT